MKGKKITMKGVKGILLIIVSLLALFGLVVAPILNIMAQNKLVSGIESLINLSYIQADNYCTITTQQQIDIAVAQAKEAEVELNKEQQDQLLATAEVLLGNCIASQGFPLSDKAVRAQELAKVLDAAQAQGQAQEVDTPVVQTQN